MKDPKGMATQLNKLPETMAHVYRRIWLLSPDAQTVGIVRTALDPEMGFHLSGVCNELSELSIGLQRESTPAAVVDIDGQPSRMLRELEEVIERFPNTRFVVVCSKFSNDLILEAMEAGARHYVPKQAIASDLAAVIRRLTPGAAASRDEQRGIIVTVLSSGGGCGATTFAVNLAKELSVLSRQRSLLIDMDYHYGAVATYLGLSADYGIADLLARATAVDAALVESICAKYGDSLSVLLSPASIDLVRTPPPAVRPLEEVLDACARGYPYTVIDAPRITLDLMLRLAAESCEVYIVGQLAVKDIRHARAIRTHLVEGGVPPASVHFVASRYAKHGSLSLEDVERGMGGATIDVIYNDYRSASHSIDVGELLSQAAPRSTLRGDIQKIATTLFRKSAAACRRLLLRRGRRRGGGRCRLGGRRRRCRFFLGGLHGVRARGRLVIAAGHALLDEGVARGAFQLLVVGAELARLHFLLGGDRPGRARQKQQGQADEADYSPHGHRSLFVPRAEG